MIITTRQAFVEDLDEIRRLDAECFPSGNADLEPAPEGELEAGVSEGNTFVAEVSGVVVGMLQLEKNSSNEWELLSLAIASSHRAKGVGKALMEKLFEQLNQSPYLVAVSCVTSPANLAMQGLLESFGFVQVGMALDHYGPGKHRLRFQLN